MQTMSTAAPRWSAAREPWLLGVVGALLALALLLLAPPGTDFAAHEYQTKLFAAHGFAFWNNLWYAGRYCLVTYSLLFYPLAALLGIKTVAVAAVGVAVAMFAVLLRRRWGARGVWSARSFAVVMPAFLLSAAFPFALGASLGLLALVALQARRWAGFALFAVASLASSPLAFLLLALGVVAIGLGERPGPRSAVIAVGVVGAVGSIELVLTGLFATHGRYPFPIAALLPALAFAVLLAACSWRVAEARLLGVLAALYAVGCLAAFGLSSDLGEGMTRLRFVGLPLIVLAASLRSWRPRALVVVMTLAVGYWTVAPSLGSVAIGAHDPSAQRTYWAPAVRFLRAHSGPGYRTEVVDTAHHWAAAYLPEAGLPIARGWFRQDDYPQNEVLYGDLGAAGLRHWLTGLGVKYVVLTDVKPDYSARREATLLRSGRSGLRRVLTTRHLQVFEVPRAVGIATGPGAPRVRRLGRETVDLVAPRAGELRVAVRWSPYWRASAGCLTEGADGMLRLRLAHPGAVRLRFTVRPSSLLGALRPGAGTRCAEASTARTAPA